MPNVKASGRDGCLHRADCLDGSLLRPIQESLQVVRMTKACAPHPKSNPFSRGPTREEENPTPDEWGRKGNHCTIGRLDKPSRSSRNRPPVQGGYR